MKEKIKRLLFENQTLRQTVLKNTFWLSFGTAVSRLIRAAIAIYIARILGTAGYGIYSYALGLAAFFTIFSDTGVSALLTRELVQESANRKAYLSTTFFIKLFLVAITILLVIFLAPLFTKIEEAKRLLPIIAFLVAFDSLRSFSAPVIRAKNKMEIEAILTILVEIFISGIVLFVLLKAPTSANLVVAYALGSFLGFLATIAVLSSYFEGVFTNFNKNLVKEILLAAWPFAIMGLFGGLMLNIDIIIIGWFRSTSELGLYAASQRPIGILYILPGLFAGSLFPIMVRIIKNNEKERAKNVLEKSLIAIFAVALPLTFGGLIVGGQLIRLLFGSAYLGATLAFQILLFTLLLVFPGNILGNLVFAYDKQKIFLTAVIGGALINVAFDLLLIPPYGIAGSAVATVLSQIFNNGYVWYKVRELNNFKIWPYLAKIFSATLIMSATSVLLLRLGINVTINVLISAILYFAVLYLLREPLFAEIKTIFES